MTYTKRFLNFLFAMSVIQIWFFLNVWVLSYLISTKPLLVLTAMVTALSPGLIMSLGYDRYVKQTMLRGPIPAWRFFGSSELILPNGAGTRTFYVLGFPVTETLFFTARWG